MKKKRKEKYIDFDLIPNTAGIITNGIYIKKDKSELIISLAWGGDYHFKPMENGEKSL